ANWARTAFGITALLQFFLALLKLAPMALHLFATGLRGAGGFLNGSASARVPPQYTVLGAFFAAGIARLWWRERNALAHELAKHSNTGAPQGPSLAFNAWAESRQRTLSRWTWSLRAALLLQLIAVTLLEFSSPAAWKNWSAQPMLFWLVWIAAVGAIWNLLSREDPRLGVGLGLGCAGVQVIPALGLPILVL